MRKTLEVTPTVELGELKQFANTDGPCLTIVLPLEKAPNTSHLEVTRIKSLLRSSEQALGELGVGPEIVKELLDPLRSLAEEQGQWNASPGGTLIVLRSPHIFRAFEIREGLKESVVAGPHFYVLSFLTTIQRENKKFYILALSQKHVRLLRCTIDSSEEVALPPDTPTSFEKWLNAPMQHAPKGEDHEGGTSPPVGSFTSSTDRDHKDEHIVNFLNAIDKGVHEVLTTDTTPMVLAGVEYERLMYKGLSVQGNIVDGVQGSPESLKGNELHKRALEVMQECWNEPLNKALDLFDKLGSEKLSTNPDFIIEAAHESRIAQLFVSEGARLKGRFDKNTLKMGGDGPEEDLANLAALQTIAFGGDVFVTEPARVPGKGPMAAVLRF